MPSRDVLPYPRPLLVLYLLYHNSMHNSADELKCLQTYCNWDAHTEAGLTLYGSIAEQLLEASRDVPCEMM